MSRFLYWLTPQRAQLLFWIALVGVSTLAFMPGDEVAITTGWDKSNHTLAFFTLALLAGRSWPRWHWWRLALPLLAYGVLIEIVQYFIGRDAAVLDVFADVVGLAIYPAIARRADRQRLYRA